MAAPPLEIVWLGRQPYAQTHALMTARLAARAAGQAGDALLLVEHDEVITVGRRSGAAANLVAAPDGVPVVEVERGGDVTWHGPGQLVGYPVVALRAEAGERDVGRFLRALEDALAAAVAALGVAGAARRAGLTGLWAGERKIASIGIAVRRWVTWHGFALNVAPDLARFRAIRPCGLDADVMTSVAALGGDARLDSARAAVAPAVAAALGRIPAAR